MKYKLVFLSKDKEFLDILKNFEKLEQFEISKDSIIIYSNKSSILRAKTNLLLRMLAVYEKFKDFFNEK